LGVPNSEPTIIAFPRSKAVLSFERSKDDDDDNEDHDEALPSTIPNPPRFERPPELLVISSGTSDDEVTRHNFVEPRLLSRNEATFNTRLPSVVVQASPQSRRRRHRHRRSPALQFAIATAFGFGIGLLIAAFYFTGGFHSLMHMR
jgi:hypothetical protein